MARSEQKLNGLATVTALLLVTCFLYFKNLGNHTLWQDEAQTALIARTVLDQGLPYGTDGKNFFSQEGGAEYGKNKLWQWHMWLPFYVLALFMKIFGDTTYVARLPFACAGVVTVMAVYAFLMSRTRSLTASGLAALALAFYVPNTLLNRQCRYYAFVSLFSVLTLYLYLRWHAQKKRRDCILLGLCTALLFHTHYLYVATMLCPLAVHWVVVSRDMRIWPGLVVLLILCLPWTGFVLGINYSGAYGGTAFSTDHFAKLLGENWRWIKGFVTPWPLWLGTLWCVWKRRYRTELFVLLSAMVATMVAVSASSPAAFFRYLAPLLPISAIILGLCLSVAGSRARWVIGIAVICLVLWQYKFAEFVYEITHDFDGPGEKIVELLNREARPTDRVLVTYDDLMLKYYTRLRVFGGLTGERLDGTLDGASGAEWIIRRHHAVSRFEGDVREFIDKNIDFSRYEKLELEVADTAFENREEPGQHLFRTATGGPRVVVWRRR